MFLHLLPKPLRKFFQMTRRQRKHELRKTLWHMPIIYVLASLIIATLTLVSDMVFNVPAHTNVLKVNFETTRILVSTLISAILLLSAFTLNILLVVLTTFSAQFSPRMLENFIADRQTQHYVGLFNGNFVYVLFIFLFISNSENENFVIVPVITVLLTFITAIGFIFFINHSTVWMQVHNITYNMKRLSEEIITQSLTEDMEKLKVVEPGDLKIDFQSDKKEIMTASSGYIQLVDFPQMVTKAREDDIIIELHEDIGSFILAGNPLFSYWGPGMERIDEDSYKRLILLDRKETEIQDANAAMSKLAEVAVKSIGNDDPRSAINAIHQLGDLMQTVDSHYTFTPYLADSEKQVRVITRPQQFENILYRGFGMIRNNANADSSIIFEIVSTLRMLARSSDPVRHQDIWHFTEDTIQNVSSDIIYNIDRTLLLEELARLAANTGNEKSYYALEKQLTGNTH